MRPPNVGGSMIGHLTHAQNHPEQPLVTKSFFGYKCIHSIISIKDSFRDSNLKSKIYYLQLQNI